MVVTVNFSEDNQVNSPDPDEVVWSLTTSPVEELISGDDEDESTVDDSIFLESSAAVIHNEHDVSIVDPVVGATYSFESTNEAIAEVYQNGHVNYVDDGTVGIIVTGPKGSRRVDVTVSEEGGQTVTLFDRFVTGSLSKHVADVISAAISGKTPGTATQDIYSVYALTTNNFKRNHSCWAWGVVDITAWVTRSSAGNYYKPGTLIAPNWILAVSHNPFNVGELVVFTDNDDVVYTRGIVEKVDLGVSNAYLDGTVDVALSRLDSALPASITPAKLAPADYLSYLPSVDGHTGSYLGNGIPLVYSNRQKKFFTNDVGSIIYQSLPNSIKTLFSANSTGERADWSNIAAIGDSGNSGCMIVNGQLVVLTIYFGGGNFQGTATSSSALLSAIDTITSSGISLADLTAFNAY